MNMKKYFAEFFGTMFLTLVVIASIFTKAGLPTSITVGLALAIFVYTIGSVSGAHLNPAVTIGAWSVKKIPTKQALFYIVAQILGGLAAFLISKGLGYVEPAFVTHFSVYNLIGEIVGMLFFAFGIAHVLFSNKDSSGAAFTIGASLTVGASLGTGLGSLGLLNPAISMGIHIFDVSYLVGPIIGAVAGMWLYKWLAGSK